MGKLLWVPEYGLGGMAKAVWLFVEQSGGISVEQLVAECGIGSTTDVEAALERLEAAGLVSSVDLTTLQERILVMDWLRSVDAIGDNCMDVDADFLHPPEQCLEESLEYESWERDIRAAGEPGVRAYRAIMWAAKGDWGNRYRESWQGGPAMNARTSAWVEWRRSAQESAD